MLGTQQDANLGFVSDLNGGFRPIRNTCELFTIEKMFNLYTCHDCFIKSMINKALIQKLLYHLITAAINKFSRQLRGRRKG